MASDNSSFADLGPPTPATATDGFESECFDVTVDLSAADPVLQTEVALAVEVENAYVGSPCGCLDQIMIHHARARAPPRRASRE